MIFSENLKKLFDIFKGHKIFHNLKFSAHRSMGLLWDSIKVTTITE
jgi:hypothetical protein